MYALALATPIYVLAQLQLRNIQATDVEQRFSFSTYLRLRIICVGIASAIILVVLFCTHPDKLTMWTCLFFAGARAAESMSDIFYGAMQLHEQMQTQAISLGLKGLVSLALLVTGLLTLHSVAGAALGMMIAWIAVLAVYDVPSAARLLRAQNPNRFSMGLALPWEETRRLLRDALPMGLVMFFLSLSLNIPRYFLKAETDMKTLGIYAALGYVQVAGAVIISALGQAASPKLARFYQFGDIDGFQRLLKKLLGVGSLLGILGVVFVSFFGRAILTTLYKPEYGSYTREFLVMSVGSGLAYVGSFLGCGMTCMRRFHQQLVTIGISTLFLAASCAWLVPRYGLLGAAGASLLSSGVMAILNGSVVLAGLSRAGKLVISVTTSVAYPVEVR